MHYCKQLLFSGTVVVLGCVELLAFKCNGSVLLKQNSTYCNDGSIANHLKWLCEIRRSQHWGFSEVHFDSVEGCFALFGPDARPTPISAFLCERG
jgi:hypothetical protein